MSGRKNVLAPFQIFEDEAMSQDLVSPATNIQWLDNVGIQIQWTGVAVGTFQIEVSADHEEDAQGNVLNEGTWIPITLSTPPIASGSANQIYIDLNQLSAPWIRTSYTNTMQESASVTTVADVSGSLNNKYILIDGSDGDDWYVWFDNGSGVDPALPNRTGVSVSYSDNDGASAIATALGGALASVTSIEDINVVSSTVTFSQVEPGSGSVQNGAASPGFTISYTSTTGVLNGFIVAKQV